MYLKEIFVKDCLEGQRPGSFMEIQIDKNV